MNNWWLVIRTVQDFTHFPKYVVLRKRLGYEVDTFIEDSFLENDVGRIAADKDEFHVPAMGTDLFVDLPPIPFRHNNIGDYERDVSAVLVKQRNSLFTIRRGKDTVARSSKYSLEKLLDDFLIFGDENGFRSIHGDIFLAGGLFLNFDSYQGKVNGEAGTFPRFAFHGDGAVMLSDYPVTDGKTEACPLSHLLGGEERFENLLPGLRVYTNTRIDNRDICVGTPRIKLDNTPGFLSRDDVSR